MKQLIIQPRRTGKSTWLLKQYNEFKFNFDNCYIVTPNPCDCLMRNNYIQSIDYLKSKWPFDSIFFIDEYFFLPDRSEFTEAIMRNNHSFIAISTSDKLYDKELINKIKLWRRNRNKPRFKGIFKDEGKMFFDFSKEYLYNFLSYPDVNVKECGMELGGTKYETEILGKLYKTD